MCALLRGGESYSLSLSDNSCDAYRCEPGFYCVDGMKYLCDSGYWGGEYGQVVWISLYYPMYFHVLYLIRIYRLVLEYALRVSIVQQDQFLPLKSCVVTLQDTADLEGCPYLFVEDTILLVSGSNHRYV